MDSKKPNRLEIKTLQELGCNLPIGIAAAPNTPRQRNFKLRPFKFKLERQISEAKEKLRGATFGEFVTRAMSIMAHSIGSKSFDNMKDGERELFLTQMNMADVMYMYVMARYEAMGPDEPVKMEPSCPRCSNHMKINALLGTMEVKVIPDAITDLSAMMPLRDGLQIRGKTLNIFKIMPLKWDVASNQDFASTNEAERDSLVIRTSIVKAEGDPSEPFVLNNEDLDEMSKYDLETCKRWIEDAAAGPKMSLDLQCDRKGCNHKFIQPINWVYDRFFSRGVQATPG